MIAMGKDGEQARAITVDPENGSLGIKRHRGGGG
jgi:hypothetical protein